MSDGSDSILSSNKFKDNSNKSSNNSSNNSSNKTKKTKKRNHSGDDFIGCFVDFIKTIPWKLAIFVFLLVIFVNSDIFYTRLLGKINGAMDGSDTTTKGECIKAGVVALAYVILYVLVDHCVI